MTLQVLAIGCWEPATYKAGANIHKDRVGVPCRMYFASGAQAKMLRALAITYSINMQAISFN